MGELAEIFEKELNQIIVKAIDQELKSKKYNKGLARAIVNRWNQQLDNETEEEFKDRVGEFWRFFFGLISTTYCNFTLLDIKSAKIL